MKFTKELLEKAKECKTLDELKALAQENGIEPDEAVLTELTKAIKAELPDDVLEDVAGGVLPLPTKPKRPNKPSSNMVR